MSVLIGSTVNYKQQRLDMETGEPVLSTVPGSVSEPAPLHYGTKLVRRWFCSHTPGVGTLEHVAVKQIHHLPLSHKTCATDPGPSPAPSRATGPLCVSRHTLARDHHCLVRDEDARRGTFSRTLLLSLGLLP